MAEWLHEEGNVNLLGFEFVEVRVELFEDDEDANPYNDLLLRMAFVKNPFDDYEELEDLALSAGELVPLANIQFDGAPKNENHHALACLARAALHMLNIDEGLPDEIDEARISLSMNKNRVLLDIVGPGDDEGDLVEMIVEEVIVDDEDDDDDDD